MNASLYGALQGPTVGPLKKSPGLTFSLSVKPLITKDEENKPSLRPTIPAGPPLVMLLGEHFADVTPLALPDLESSRES